MKQQNNMSQEQNLFIVGIGASAGGLEALETFFNALSTNSGAAFIVIQHLSPDYKSLMGEILAKHTDMPVIQAKEKMLVEANHVYLIPRSNNMTIYQKRLQLTARQPHQRINLPIDIFLESLANEAREKAVAVILSGTGSDGTRGLQVVKDKGGVIMVQSPKSARFDGMPRSAIATNVIDFILPPNEIAKKLVDYVQQPRVTLQAKDVAETETYEEILNKIFMLIRNQKEVDFSFYKQNSVIRRLERRMSINQTPTLDDYFQFLQRDPDEIHTLFKEMLIGVTQFFRDKEAFDFIKEEVIPEIFSSKRENEQIRVWVAGCSTGEEAYSLVILLHDYMETHNLNFDVKVFATDIDQESLKFASRGVYPRSIAMDVSAKQLAKHFKQIGSSYEINHPLREMVIFARQNLIKDPPFSKIDFISCRNLLIYLQPVTQKKIISVFQFSLISQRFLFLGSSETIGLDQNYFQVIHSHWKIYKKRRGKSQALQNPFLNMVNINKPATTDKTAPQYTEERRRHNSYEELYQQLIEAFLPPCVVINREGDVLHSFGMVHHYLRLPTGGAFDANLLRMVDSHLGIALSTGIHQALSEEEMVVYRNFAFKTEETMQLVDLYIKPQIDKANRPHLLFIQFKPSENESSDEKAFQQTYNVEQRVKQRIADLERELKYSKGNLQATIEELETSNEELQAVNEEMLSSNEELQSTNEELQSVNEELITVNSEFQAKILELTELNNDMNNLLTSTELATIFLDNELHIRKFTPMIQQNVNMFNVERGKSISALSQWLIDCDLEAEARTALHNLQTKEREVQGKNKRWYLMKALPYRTSDNTIKGVVITFVDITQLKIIQNDLLVHKKSLAEQKQFMESVAQASPIMLYVYDVIEGKNIYSNREITTVLGYNRQDLQDKFNILEQLMHPEDFITYPLHLRKLANSKPQEVFELLYRLKHKDGTWRWIHSFDLVFERDQNGVMKKMLGAAEDVTEEIETREALAAREARYRLLAEATSEGVSILQDEKIIDANVVFTHLLGYSLSELIGQKITDFITPETLSHFKEKLVEPKSSEPYLIEFIHKKGYTFWAKIVNNTKLKNHKMLRVISCRPVENELF